MANETVVRAAEGYWDTWWNGLQNTTRESMRSAIERHLSTGSSRRQLVNELSSLFGRERAKMIATTETTRLYAIGNEAAFEAAGVVNNEWRTVMDSRVDPICEALEGKRKIEDERTESPPAHVRCRCWISPITEGRTITTEGGALPEDES
jgi:SPP1 gp7 family putative phage head morphogenesis protein